MATANVVFGSVRGGLPLLDASTLTSAPVSSGSASSAAPAGTSAARITTIGGAMYAAFSTGTPDPTQAPRMYIPAESAVEVALAPGFKVGVVNA